MKTLKIIQLVLMLVLIVGLVAVLIIGINSNFSFNGFFNFNSVEIFDKEFDSENVKNIVFDLSSSDVKVCYSDTEKIRVVYRGAKKELEDSTVSAEFSNDTLLIEQDYRNDWFQWGVARLVTVYLPESFKGAFNYSCSSGDLILTEAFSFSEITTVSTSGDVIASDLTCEKIQTTSSSGDVKFKVLKSGEYMFKLTSGDFYVDQLQGTGSLSLTSGDVSIEKLYGAGAFRTTSGGIRIGIYEATGDVEVKVTSGDAAINIYGGTAFLCDFSVTSGDISTDFGSADSGLVGESFSGSVGENPVNRLRIDTTSGDISVYSK